MVHIYAAQYFLVTSYWRCPTDRVWSKFLSLIHPAIIKELSRKDFGLALQTIILFPILSKSNFPLYKLSPYLWFNSHIEFFVLFTPF